MPDPSTRAELAIAVSARREALESAVATLWREARLPEHQAPANQQLTYRGGLRRAARLITAQLAAARAAGDVVTAPLLAELDERERLLRLLYPVYDTWWHRVGTTEPPPELINAGVASLLSLVDDNQMEAVCLAVQPHEPRIRELLSLPPLAAPAEDVKDTTTV